MTRVASIGECMIELSEAAGAILLPMQWTGQECGGQTPRADACRYNVARRPALALVAREGV